MGFFFRMRYYAASLPRHGARIRRSPQGRSLAGARRPPAAASDSGPSGHTRRCRSCRREFMPSLEDTKGTRFGSAPMAAPVSLGTSLGHQRRGRCLRGQGPGVRRPLHSPTRAIPSAASPARSPDLADHQRPRRPEQEPAFGAHRVDRARAAAGQRTCGAPSAAALGPAVPPYTQAALRETVRHRLSVLT